MGVSAQAQGRSSFTDRSSFPANTMEVTTLQGRIQRLEERNRALIEQLARGSAGQCTNVT